MEGLCLSLLFGIYSHCLLISGFNYNFCGQTENEFSPVYNFTDCPQSSIDGFEIMQPKPICEIEIKE